MKDFKNIFKNSKFVYLWVSQILSQLTINIMNFLILTRLFTITESAIATSLLWIAYALPAIFVGPLGAASVDLVDRRKTLMVTNLLQSLTVFGFILLNQDNIFLLYILVIIYALLNQFYVPAESSSLPSMVSKKLLPHANSFFFITQQAALVLGFGAAGILQFLTGFRVSLIICATFLFVAFISVSFLPKMRPKVVVPEALDKLLITFFKSIYEGYRFIKDNKSVLFPLLLLLGSQVGLAMIIVTLPVIADEILGVAVHYAGVLVVVPAGIGATIGSILISKNLTKVWRKKLVIETSAGVVALSIGLIILLIPHVNVILRLILEPLLVMIVGLGYIGVVIPTLTYLQEATPLWLRGRVFGNMWFLATIATIFPVLFSGVITEFFGVRALLVLVMIAMMFVFYYSKTRGQDLIVSHIKNNGKK